MRRSLPLCAALAVSLLAGILPSASPVQAAPQPSVLPVSWELDVKFDAPKRLIIDHKAYWFIHYTVTNNTNQDQLFTPEFQLITDTGQIVDGNKNTPQPVLDSIKNLYGKLLLTPLQVLGRLLQGEDNAKDSVAVFSGIDSDARSFTIYASGFSGETAQVTDPINGKTVLLHKAIQLKYDVPGQAITIDPTVLFKGQTAVMR
jgi:hypothetical protein